MDPILNSDKVWIWGIGPTWYARHFGSPGEQSTTQDLADFFGCNNVMYFDYVYPREDLNTLNQFKRVVISITDEPSNMMSKTSEVVNFSQGHENVVGAIIDDLTTIYLHKNGDHKISPEQVGEMKKLLISKNPSLKLYAVFYTMNFDIDFTAYLPYIDIVSLWVWNARNLKNLDKYLRKASKIFGDKPILLGLYWFDFPKYKALMPLKLLKFEFKKAAKYLHEQQIDGIQILGRYLKEDLESPQAKWIQDYLKENFTKY